MKAFCKCALLFLLMVAMSVNYSYAQDSYKHGLGLRLGSSYGLTYKTFLSDKLAFEGILSTRYYGRSFSYYNGKGNKDGYWGKSAGKGGNLTALLEYHIPFPKAEGLQFYFGGGLHIGSRRGYKDHYYYPEDRNYLTMGLDLIIGLEYVFQEVPIVLGLDYKPGFDFIGAYRPWGDEVALSVRVLLSRL